MCGIVGYVGERQAAPILLDGLAKLEYRGYDSAGVCVFFNKQLHVAKTKGRLAALGEMTAQGSGVPGCLGIGHTRWATHGAPSKENSHPHVSTNGKISVVHNGIIENYLFLKEFLRSAGKTFASETDTETVANLVEYHYEREGALFTAVKKAVAMLEGSYALGIVCVDDPERIVAVKKDSPLIFGFGKGENFIASDVPAILKHTREVAYLNDGDLVVFSKDSVEFYNTLGERTEKVPEHIDWEITAAEKGGYPHFMMKEIHEQPKAIRDTLKNLTQDGRVTLGNIELTRDYLSGVRRIYIVACGSAYYVGCLGKYILEKSCRIPVEPVLASEFRYSQPVLGEDTLVIIISQSGETADTLAALREANSMGARTLAIVNVVGSAIAKAASDVIYTCAGPEIAVATTKAYSTQLLVMYLLAMYIGDIMGTFKKREYDEVFQALQALPALISETITQERLAEMQACAARYCKHHDVFFIGRNVDSATCMEGSLKLKELAYVHSEAYAAGELKHGPISLIEENTLVIAVATTAELFDKTMSNVKEVKARGANVLGLTTENYREEIAKTVDSLLTVPKTHPLLQPSLNVIPLQVFSYYVALARGCDVDKPRNLAKSVTVE
ncbi:MAG: glutamine--fructose-6-phosphate transaminase (isomerizing) [Oscillospiraceae bacterium]|jgi:glucosamine--fructose-6-phosphate aminotransferase (isomerizing)|nr:glutamine--fructose-6-phosphate transaminase (isomerizing) [Oscillospiraceae bacterium]